LHPDIVTAKNIPAAKTNTFPTAKLYILFISLSKIKCRDIAGFQQATSLSGTAFAHLPVAWPHTVHIPLVSGGNALYPQDLPLTPHSIPLLYPLDRKSQGKSDMKPGPFLRETGNLLRFSLICAMLNACKLGKHRGIAASGTMVGF
jgi:hypothetical protein